MLKCLCSNSKNKNPDYGKVTMFSRNFFAGANSSKDHRFDKLKKGNRIKFSSVVSESLEINNINYDSFRQWIHEQLEPLNVDELDEDIIMGFLQTDTIESQPFAEQIIPLIGEKAVEFIEKLWPLLEDAQKSETGIPTQFLEEAKKKIAERLMQNQQIAQKLDDSDSSSSSSTSSSSSSSDLETLAEEPPPPKIEPPKPAHINITKPIIPPQRPMGPPKIVPQNEQNIVVRKVVYEAKQSDEQEKSPKKHRKHHLQHHHHHRHGHHHRRYSSYSSSSSSD